MGLTKNPFPTRDDFFIYRGPYSLVPRRGKFICRWLREYYGGRRGGGARRGRHVRPRPGSDRRAEGIARACVEINQ